MAVPEYMNDLRKSSQLGFGVYSWCCPLLDFYKFFFQFRTTVTPDNTTEIKMR